jgi:hypothetical protein
LYYLALTKQTGDFPCHLGQGFEIRWLMEALFYCLQMLAKEDVHTSPCLQSMNDVSTAVNSDYVTSTDGQQLPYVQAPEFEITSILMDSPAVASLVDFVQLELPKWDFLFQLDLINSHYVN